MCGIIAWQGTKAKTFEEILEYAYVNKYRGEDGIGIVYEEDGEIKHLKNLYPLHEIHEIKLDDTTCVKKQRVGSFEFITKDEDNYNEKQKAFTKYIHKLNKKSSKFIYMHHRKGTMGDISLENQHPIKVGNNLYIHNGTAYLSDAVKRYLEVMEGLIFNTETDTEVVATVYNKFKEYFNDEEKAFEELTNIFDSGYGILIEITPEGKVTVIKDECRRLWYYQFTDGYLMTSEPISSIEGYTDIGYLPYGITHMDKPLIISKKEEYDSAVEAWNIKPNFSETAYKLGKCEICNTDNKLTKSTYYVGDHPVKEDQALHVCFECLCLYKSKTEETNPEDRLEDKIAKYGNLIGDITDTKKFMVIDIANT
jgi:hypothetical protein